MLSRAWRQKIEAWLQENEKEERDTEDLRRRSRRLQNKRRSLEADSGLNFIVVAFFIMFLSFACLQYIVEA